MPNLTPNNFPEPTFMFFIEEIFPARAQKYISKFSSLILLSILVFHIPRKT